MVKGKDVVVVREVGGDVGSLESVLVVAVETTISCPPMSDSRSDSIPLRPSQTFLTLFPIRTQPVDSYSPESSTFLYSFHFQLPHCRGVTLRTTGVPDLRVDDP